MSYFNHAYRKSFVGTKATQAAVPGTSNAVDDGFLLDAGVPTSALANNLVPNTLGVGTYGFFNPNTYLSVNNASAEVVAGKPLVFAAAALFTNDKIGPFHGGYKESNKSKMINPRFVHKFSKMTGSGPEQSIWHLGNTNWNADAIATLGALTAGTGYTNGTYTNVALVGGTGVASFATVVVAGGIVTSITITQPGQGYTVGDVLTLPASVPFAPGTPASTVVATIKYNTAGTAPCKFDFVCGETYNLRLDLWGSPVLRYLNHDLYKTLASYTGCCPAGTIVPGNVDSTLVMIDWANQIVNDVWLQYFIRPIVYTQTGVPLFATAAEAVTAGFPAASPLTPGIPGSASIWANYVSPGYIAGALGGIRLIGAYIETKFGNCSFQNTDFYEKEVVQMNVSLTDLTGDPCDFSALCANKEYAGFTGQGYGETVLRDVILDESYLQNHFSNDVRIREITQGDQYFAAIPRLDAFGNNVFYTRYVIQHSVPRYNNPSGVYDDDQYALNIYVPAASGAATAFETFMATWLGAAAVGGVVTLQTYGHTPFVPAVL
jgi:hypothetical protein